MLWDPKWDGRGLRGLSRVKALVKMQKAKMKIHVNNFESWGKKMTITKCPQICPWSTRRDHLLSRCWLFSWRDGRFRIATEGNIGWPKKINYHHEGSANTDNHKICCSINCDTVVKRKLFFCLFDNKDTGV